MPASIWLRLSNEQEASLRALIERLAGAHGTVPFQPHLTVCSPQSAASWDAAAEYAVDETQRQPSWSSDENILKSIAEECARRVEATEFVLDHPVIVAPDGEWRNIRSWRVMRTL